MLTVQTYLASSPISGIGLFTAEFIPEGSIVWKNGTDSEITLKPEIHEKLSEYMKEVFRFHGYHDKKTNEWKLPLDNSRFMNHAAQPNLGQDIWGNSYAIFDIQKGEELTCNYALFDDSKSFL